MGASLLERRGRIRKRGMNPSAINQPNRIQTPISSSLQMQHPLWVKWSLLSISPNESTLLNTRSNNHQQQRGHRQLSLRIIRNKLEMPSWTNMLIQLPFNNLDCNSSFCNPPKFSFLPKLLPCTSTHQLCSLTTRPVLKRINQNVWWVTKLKATTVSKIKWKGMSLLLCQRKQIKMRNSLFWYLALRNFSKSKAQQQHKKEKHPADKVLCSRLTSKWSLLFLLDILHLLLLIWTLKAPFSSLEIILPKYLKWVSLLVCFLQAQLEVSN